MCCVAGLSGTVACTMSRENTLCGRGAAKSARPVKPLACAVLQMSGHINDTHLLITELHELWADEQVEVWQAVRAGV